MRVEGRLPRWAWILLIFLFQPWSGPLGLVLGVYARTPLDSAWLNRPDGEDGLRGDGGGAARAPAPAPRAPTSEGLSPLAQKTGSRETMLNQFGVFEEQHGPSKSGQRQQGRRRLFTGVRGGGLASGGSYSMSYVYSMGMPSSRPTGKPTETAPPSSVPTSNPSGRLVLPTNHPTRTGSPTGKASPSPTEEVGFADTTFSPSGAPSDLPTGQPSGQPTVGPTANTGSPTSSPTKWKQNPADLGFSDANGLFFVLGDSRNARSRTSASSALGGPDLDPSISKVRNVYSRVGGDAGGFAISPTKVYLAGENSTRAFDKTTLVSSVPLAALKGAAFCSNIATGDVYVLADANFAPLTGPGTISFLMAIDDSTMSKSTNVKKHVVLNTPITVGYHSGIFSGFNRVVIVDRDTMAAWNINTNNGHVVFIGSALCKWAYTRSWASWGVAEFSYERRVHILYGAAGGGGIERQSINDVARDGGYQHQSATETVYEGSLGDLVAFSVDIPSSRWYFHYAGAGDFGGVGRSSVMLGFGKGKFGFEIPTSQPTSQPTRYPTGQPSGQPSSSPSVHPSTLPSSQPTGSPSSHPTSRPTALPIFHPTGYPSLYPSQAPTGEPTVTPTGQPSAQPTGEPSAQPTVQPTGQPSSQPSGAPTDEPSGQPTGQPTRTPSSFPTTQPTGEPSGRPMTNPTSQPTGQPTGLPSSQPSGKPIAVPSGKPSGTPSTPPTREPSTQKPSPEPTAEPTPVPTAEPTPAPSAEPTAVPTPLPTAEPTILSTFAPSADPTVLPTALPSPLPTDFPTEGPSPNPTALPTPRPTKTDEFYAPKPSPHPTEYPTGRPTVPTGQPTSFPSFQPTGQPSGQPTALPSGQPSSQPSRRPTLQPSSAPTSPTGQPSGRPSGQPSTQPSSLPSAQPVLIPTSRPTGQPSVQPTGQPSMIPSSIPTGIPTRPSSKPSGQPSRVPSGQPSVQPSSLPSGQPSSKPTTQPTAQPSGEPSGQPSSEPSGQPTAQPSGEPSRQPTGQPSRQPSRQPTGQPSRQPSGQPSRCPTRQPTGQPTRVPTGQPSSLPSSQPTGQPSRVPTGQPTRRPTRQPTRQPTRVPTGQPTRLPSRQPTSQPTRVPTGQPTSAPSRRPTAQPTRSPTGQPTREPSRQPTGQPTRAPVRPTGQPSRIPTSQPSCQPTSSPTTPKPTYRVTVSEPKMFLKNNIIELSVTDVVEGMKASQYTTTVINALARAVYMSSAGKEILRDYLVSSVGPNGLKVAFTALTATDTAKGVSLFYKLRLSIVPEIVANDGSIVVSAYTPWVANQVLAIQKIFSLACTSGDLKAAAIQAVPLVTTKSQRMLIEQDQRRLQSATVFDSSTFLAPTFGSPVLTQDASYSPSAAPTFIALPISVVGVAIAKSTSVDQKRNIALNVSISSGGSWAGVFYCGAYTSKLSFTAGQDGTILKSATFGDKVQFTDSVGQFKYNSLVISGLTPTTTYYTYCYLELSGRGVSWLNTYGADTTRYSCSRVGGCSTTTAVLATQLTITTQCCKTVTYVNPPPAVFWDIFSIYLNSDKSYYFNFLISDPPKMTMALNVSLVACTDKSAFPLGYCTSSGEIALNATSQLPLLKISSTRFSYSSTSAGFTGYFFLTYPSSTKDSSLTGYVGIRMTLPSSLDGEYSGPAVQVVKILNGNAKRPAPKLYLAPNGVRMSDSGAYAMALFDSACDILGAGFVSNTFRCNKLFSFPNATNKDGKKWDPATTVACTWINTTAIRLDFANPKFSGLKNPYDANALPSGGSEITLKKGFIPAFCPTDPLTKLKANCTGWPTNAEQSVVVAGSSSPLAVVATINSPYFLSACDPAVVDAGGSAGNGGRQFTKTNWIIQYVADADGNPQKNMPNALNSVNDPLYNKTKDYFTCVNYGGTNCKYKYQGAFPPSTSYTVGEESADYLDCLARKVCLPGPRLYNIEFTMLQPPPFYASVPRRLFNSDAYFTDAYDPTKSFGCGRGGGCGPGTYQVYFYIENFLGGKGRNVFTISVSGNRNVPGAIITGQSDNYIATSDMLTLTGSGSLSNCTQASSLSFVWSVYPYPFTSGAPAVGSIVNPTLQTVSADPKVLRLYPYSLPVGSYTVVMTVKPTGSRSAASPYIASSNDSVSVSANVFVGHGVVQAAVIGGYSRNTSVDRDIVIDAYKSQDYDLQPIPNTPCPTISYRWSCIGTSRNVSGFDCTPLILSAIPTLYSKKVPTTTSSKIYFLANSLKVYQSYDVTLYVYTPDGRADSRIITLSITESGTPAVALTSTAIKFNADAKLSVFGTISAHFAVGAVWSVYYAGIQVYPQNMTAMDKFFSDQEAGASANGISYPLAFQPYQFVAGRTYQFKLTASPQKQPELAASAMISLVCNSPPSGGTFVISSDSGTYIYLGPGYTYDYYTNQKTQLGGFANGTALTSVFTITISLWSTDPDNMPLLFQFGYQMSPTSPELLIQQYKVSTFVAVTFPAGLAQYDDTIIVVNSAQDKYAATATIQTYIVVVNPPGDQAAFLKNALSSGLANALASGNADATYQTVNNVASSLNGVNCTGHGVSECAKFNRSACLTVPLTCESCIDGFIGIVGPSNTRCFNASTNAGKNGYPCKSDKDCVYNFCSNGLCSAPLLVCPTTDKTTICSGHGKCTYADTAGNVKSVCTIADVYCRASCTCDDGYSTSDCSLTTQQALDRDENRGKMCQALYDTALKQDKSSALLDSLVGTLLASFNPAEVITEASKASCRTALSTMANIGASGYLKGCKPLTVTFLTKTVSTFVTPPAAGDASATGSATTSVANLLKGVTGTTVAGQAPVPLVSPNVRVAVNNAQQSSLNGAGLEPPSTEAEAAYGAPQPKVGLPDSGFSQCGLPTGANYAKLSTMQWGSNPYADSATIKSPILRFSNAKVKAPKTSLLTPTGRRGLKLTSRIVNLLATPVYYITLQYSAAQNMNFSQDLTKKPKRGSKSNFSLPKCQINTGTAYIDCHKCNVSSYTNTNVTYGCFDITQMCPPGSSLAKKAVARRHLSVAEFSDYERVLEREFEAEEMTLQDRDRMLFDGDWRTRLPTESEMVFLEEEERFSRTIDQRRRNLAGDDGQGDDDGANGDPSSAASNAISNFGALLAAIMAQLAATLSSNPFALDPSKSIPILTFISVLGFVLIGGFTGFLRWDTYDHNYEIYVKEAHSQARRQQVAENLKKGISPSAQKKTSSFFDVAAAFTSKSKNELRQSSMANMAHGSRIVAATNTAVAANPGDTRLEVGSMQGFKVGMSVEIGSGGRIDRACVTGFGSIIIDTPLKYYHPRGTPVVGYEGLQNPSRGSKPGYNEKDYSGGSSTSSKDESIGYTSTEEDTGDYTTDDGSQTGRSKSDQSDVVGLAAGYMDEFLNVVLPARTLLSESHLLGRLLGKLREKHYYLRMFATPSVSESRVIRYCILCQAVMISLFVNTLFFGTFAPDDTTCPSLVLKEMCVAVPSQINPKGLCLWTPDADPEEHPSVYGGTCTLRPLPESITFTIMVAILCSIFSTPFDLFMTFILERYCRRRPRFEDWGWSSDRIVGASTDAYKPKNAERVGHLAKLMEEVEADRNDEMGEEKERRQDDFMARQIYLDFVGPQEEATALLQQVRTYLTEDLEGGDMPWGDGNTSGGSSKGSEKTQKIEAMRKRIGIHLDLTPEPLTLRQWLMYGTPRKRIDAKITKARATASKIEEQLEEFDELETDLKDISLVQNFILEQLTPIRRYALKFEFFVFDGYAPDDCSPLGWCISWFFYIGLLAFFWYWLFAWGVKQGGAVLYAWGMNFLIGFVLDVFGTAIIRIIIMDLIGIDAVRPQLRVIRRVLANVGIAYCQEAADRTKEPRVVQHFSPTCRAARTFVAKDLASARILRHIDDLDVERCREGRTGGIPTWMIVIIAIPAVANLISDGLGDTVIDNMVNLALTALILFGSFINDNGPALIAIPCGFIALWWFYEYGVLAPSKSRVKRLAANADNAQQRWRTTRRPGRYSTLGWMSASVSSTLDSLAKCIVFFTRESFKERINSALKKMQQASLTWQRMNIPISLQARVLTEAELKKQLTSAMRITENKEKGSQGVRQQIIDLLPREILAMRSMETNQDWKVPTPWLTREFTEMTGPEELVLYRNQPRLGPSLVFRNTAITQSAEVACQRMLQSYVGDAMTGDEDFQYYSSLVDATKFDNFIYTPELVNMLNQSWESYYPGGLIMSETERGEMRDSFVQWLLSVAGPSGQGVRFGIFRRWYISECTRISRIRFSAKKKQFVPAGHFRVEMERTEEPWKREEQRDRPSGGKLRAPPSVSDSDSSSSTDSGIDGFRDATAVGKGRKSSSSSSNSGDSVGFSAWSSVSGSDAGTGDSADSGVFGFKDPTLRKQGTSASSDSRSSGGLDMQLRPPPRLAPGAAAGGRGRALTKPAPPVNKPGAAAVLSPQNRFSSNRSVSSAGGGDDNVDLDGWDSDSRASSDAGSTGDSLASADSDDSVVLTTFDPRPIDVNKPKTVTAIAGDLTVGTVATSLSMLGGAMSTVAGSALSATRTVAGAATVKKTTTTNPVLQYASDSSQSSASDADEEMVAPSRNGRRQPDRSKFAGRRTDQF